MRHPLLIFASLLVSLSSLHAELSPSDLREDQITELNLLTMRYISKWDLVHAKTLCEAALYLDQYNVTAWKLMQRICPPGRTTREQRDRLERFSDDTFSGRAVQSQMESFHAVTSGTLSNGMPTGGRR